ncbi:MAG: type transport system permease protein, partial [Frankiales bacterium]|nr:type transport system permease protein [Frankiales bacterium]
MTTLTAEPAHTTSAAAVQVQPVTQARVLSSEWIKMRSLRSTGLTLLAGLVAMVAVGWLVGWATNAHWSRMAADERARFNPIDSSLTGYHLAQLAVGVLGVLLISGEYATGMI